MHGFSLPDIIGSVGVSLLLAAFFMNIVGILRMDSLTYLIFNFVGAVLACLSSWMIGFIPFVVLEGTWALVAIVTLLRQVFFRGGTTD